MKNTARLCVITIIVVLILFFATLRVFALSPGRPTPLPPLSEINYKVRWDTNWTHGTFYYYAWEG